TGHSSLSYLHQFPVRQLKIDKTFIDSLDSKDGKSVIARTAINLAKDFSITSVAEGVETPKQQDRLSELGCDMMQGYYHARPMPFDPFRAFLIGHADKKS
ncbi:MAG: EAL domain-containing protein, partial [Candidatus Izemoplasmataceae bacterium]